MPYTLHVYRRSTVKKPRATLVFLHGIGNSGVTWDEVSAGLPDDIDLYVIDLLGFGDSPKPSWAVYDAKTQARALSKTLLVNCEFSKVILIGHSMGSLVAVEYSKRYPRSVRALLLCSPPIYNTEREGSGKLLFDREEQLKRLMGLAASRPADLLLVTRLAKTVKLLNPEFDVTKLNTDTYTAALRTNILSQTSLRDIVLLKQPLTIIYGILDPFIISENIKAVTQNRPNVTTESFIGGHEIVGRYVGRITRHIERIISETQG